MWFYDESQVVNKVEADEKEDKLYYFRRGDFFYSTKTGRGVLLCVMSQNFF